MTKWREKLNVSGEGERLKPISRFSETNIVKSGRWDLSARLSLDR